MRPSSQFFTQSLNFADEDYYKQSVRLNHTKFFKTSRNVFLDKIKQTSRFNFNQLEKKRKKAQSTLAYSNNQKNQRQSYESQHKNYLSSIYHPTLQQQHDDLTPWNHNVSHTSREVYDARFKLNKEREKIKEMIHSYKSTKNQGNILQHANFVKSSSKKKKVKYVLVQLETEQNKFKNNRNPTKLIKSLDLNKSYERYMKNDSKISKSLFKIPETSQSFNNRQDSSKRLNLRQDHLQVKTINTLDQKQQLIQILKKDFKFSQYMSSNFEEYDLSCSSKKFLPIQEEKAPILQEKIVGKDRNILQKAKKFKVERKKNGLRRSNKIRPYIQTSRDVLKPPPQYQKVSFEVSGNKTHKLQYRLKS